MPYCQETNCYQQATPGENYCSNHETDCWEDYFPQRCSKRISVDEIWYCSYHRESYKSLVRQRTGLTNIQDVRRFWSWWNENLATVVNGTCPYSIWLIVYEPTQNGGKIKEILEKFEITEEIIKKSFAYYNKYDLDDVKTMSFCLTSSDGRYLRGDNPIFYVHPKADIYANFNEIITSPYMKRIDLPYEIRHNIELDNIGIPEPVIDGVTYTREPDKYLKPFDIVKIDLGDFRHVGVYLGNNQVCHYSKAKNGTKIDSWEEFLEGGEDWIKDEIFGTASSSNCPCSLYAYHAIIPFKNHKIAAQQIAWAEDINFRKNDYNLADRNCEHFANMIAYGINYSEQVQNSRFINLGYSNKNNGKGSTIKLIDEITESNDKLGCLSPSHWRASQVQAQIVILPKQNCQIM